MRAKTEREAPTKASDLVNLLKKSLERAPEGEPGGTKAKATKKRRRAA